jgi:hypothetical protein
MTAERPTANGVIRDGIAVVKMPQRTVAADESCLRERLSEFRALLVISLLMTESVSEDQILGLATSSAPGLGHWRVEGYRFADGQWHAGLHGFASAPSGLGTQLAVLGGKGGPVNLAGRTWAWTARSAT